MADDEQFLVITPEHLRELLRRHLDAPAAAAVLEDVEHEALRTEVLDSAVVPPLVSVIAQLTEQVSIMAAGSRAPSTTITEESAVAAWRAVCPVYEDKAVPFLERLGIDVEQEPKHRI